MAQLLGRVEGLVVPDHALILVLGTGFDELADPDFHTNRLCYGARDLLYLLYLLYLLSADSTTHAAAVTIEAWNTAPPTNDCPTWDAHDDTQLTLTTGEVYVSAMTERPVSPVLAAGPAGAYHAHVDTARQRETGPNPPDPDDDSSTAPTERFRVRIWPSHNP